jgi:hypothetical protein
MSIATISVRPSPIQPSSEPSKDLQILIQEVVKRSLIELSVSLCIGTTVFFFTATPLQGTLIFAAIAIQTLFNLALRLAKTIAVQDKQFKESAWIASSCSYLCPTAFGYLTAINAQILLHEAGHALAANCVFQNAHPKIAITPCLCGLTKFSTTHLTWLGEKLGRKSAMLFVTFMGPACSLLVSSIAIAVGIAVRGRFPELGQYLMSVGKGDFFAHSFYAFTALMPGPPHSAHDYVRFRLHGIHPLFAAIVMTTIPLLVSRFFKNQPCSNEHAHSYKAPA